MSHCLLTWGNSHHSGSSTHFGVVPCKASLQDTVQRCACCVESKATRKVALTQSPAHRTHRALCDPLSMCLQWRLCCLHVLSDLSVQCSPTTTFRVRCCVCHIYFCAVSFSVLPPCADRQQAQARRQCDRGGSAEDSPRPAHRGRACATTAWWACSTWRPGWAAWAACPSTTSWRMPPPPRSAGRRRAPTPHRCPASHVRLAISHASFGVGVHDAWWPRLPDT